ncbi:MAG: hypothetical protein M1457_08355, partial [bacterium]|nr:hypothetical protein [bacterium]
SRRDPIRLFSFAQAGNPEGWRFEGEAFGVAAVERLFNRPTLNSLARAGESATGRAISPEFVLEPGFHTLVIQCQGGRSTPDGRLAARLVDARTGAALAELPPGGSHALAPLRIDVARWAGRMVRLELVDENRAASFAWIGIGDVTLAPR